MDVSQSVACFRSLEMILNAGQWLGLAFTIASALLALVGHFFVLLLFLLLGPTSLQLCSQSTLLTVKVTSPSSFTK